MKKLKDKLDICFLSLKHYQIKGIFTINLRFVPWYLKESSLHTKITWLLIFLNLFLVVLGTKPKSSHSLAKKSSTSELLLHPQACLVVGEFCLFVHLDLMLICFLWFLLYIQEFMCFLFFSGSLLLSHVCIFFCNEVLLTHPEKITNINDNNVDKNNKSLPFAYVGYILFFS